MAARIEPVATKDCGPQATECPAIPARVIATCFALIGFAVAVVVGAAAGNPTDTVISRALIVMLVCWPVGRLAGGVAQRVMNDHIEDYRRQHPILEDPAPADSIADASAQSADAVGAANQTTQASIRG